MLIPALLTPSCDILRVHLASWHVAFVSADDHLDSALVDTVTAHLFFPMNKRAETVLVVNVVDHDDSIGIFIEFLTNKAIVIIARQIEEIDGDRLTLNCELLNAIIDTDS